MVLESHLWAPILTLRLGGRRPVRTLRSLNIEVYSNPNLLGELTHELRQNGVGMGFCGCF